MADVAAQSIEEFADRIIYRYPGGRYEQASTDYYGSLTIGLKTLVNTQASISYNIPRSGISARFFKVEWNMTASVAILADGVASYFLVKTDFFRIVASSLNYDGKSLQTEFYKEQTENIVSAPQLRSINITNIQIEPRFDLSLIQSTGLSYVRAAPSPGTCYLIAILQPVVTHYKK